MNYFRITGYCPEDDFCFILDSFGKYEKLWQFSALLIQKGLKTIEQVPANLQAEVKYALKGLE